MNTAKAIAAYLVLFDTVEPYLRKSGVSNEQMAGLVGSVMSAAHEINEEERVALPRLLMAVAGSSFDMGYAKALADIHSEKVVV